MVSERSPFLGVSLISEQAGAASGVAFGGKPRLGRRAMYSHHIIAPRKRQVIVESAVRLRLGGFRKIGWLGIVIVEGEETAVGRYVDALSRLREAERSRASLFIHRAVPPPPGVSLSFRNEEIYFDTVKSV